MRNRGYYRKLKSSLGKNPSTMSQSVTPKSGTAEQNQEELKNLTINLKGSQPSLQRTREEVFFQQNGRGIGMASPANSLGTESLVTPNTTPEPSGSPRIMEQEPMAIPPPTINPYDRYMPAPSMMSPAGYMPYFYPPQPQTVYWMHSPYYHPAAQMEAVIPQQPFDYSIPPPPVNMMMPPHQYPPPPMYKMSQPERYVQMEPVQSTSMPEPEIAPVSVSSVVSDVQQKEPSVSPAISDEQNTEVDVKSDELGEIVELIEEIQIFEPPEVKDPNENVVTVQEVTEPQSTMSWYDESVSAATGATDYRDLSRQDNSRASEASGYDNSKKGGYNRNHNHRMDRTANRDHGDQNRYPSRRNSRNRSYNRYQDQGSRSATPEQRYNYRNNGNNGNNNSYPRSQPRDDRRYPNNDQSSRGRRSQDHRYDDSSYSQSQSREVNYGRSDNGKNYRDNGHNYRDHSQYYRDNEQNNYRDNGQNYRQRYQSPARYDDDRQGLRRSGSYRSNSRHEYRDEPIKPIPRNRPEQQNYKGSRGRPPIPPNRQQNAEKMRDSRPVENKSSDDDNFEFLGPSRVGRNENLDVKKMVKQKKAVIMDDVREPQASHSKPSESKNQPRQNYQQFSQYKGRKYK